MSTMVKIEVPEEFAEKAARIARERHTSVAALLQRGIDLMIEDEAETERLHRKKLSPERAKEVVNQLRGILAGSEFEGMTMKDIRQMRLDEKYPRDTPPTSDAATPTE